MRAIVAGSAFVLSGTVASASDPALRVSGAIETVYRYASDRCDWRTIPDSPARALRRHDGSIALIAAHFRNRFLVGPDFDRLRPACGSVSAGAESADPAAFDDRFWIQALAPLPDGRVFALASHEYMGSRHPGVCRAGVGPVACWYSAIVAATGDEASLDFRLRPRASRLVAPPPRPFDPAGTTAGFLTTTNIVFSGGYGHILAWREASGPGPGARGHCLFRAPAADLLGGWEVLSGGRYRPVGDPYGEAPPACDLVGAGILSGKVRSLVRLEESGLWLGVFATRRQGRDGKPEHGVYTAVSSDLVGWRGGERLAEYEPFWGTGRCGTYYEYPSLIDHGSRSRVFDTGGRDLFLYMTRFNWEDCRRTRMDRDLVRVRVTVGGP